MSPVQLEEACLREWKPFALVHSFLVRKPVTPKVRLAAFARVEPVEGSSQVSTDWKKAQKTAATENSK